MIECPYLLHALSPLHAGVGHSAGVIDLPIARMKATGIPFVPGSSIKGVLRDVRAGNSDAASNAVLAAFGPPTTEPDKHAGALVVGDARLLALPVRSFRGAFAMVTSPLLLMLAARDTGWQLDIPTPSPRRALIGPGNICRHQVDNQNLLFLEDLDLQIEREDAAVADWAAKICEAVGGEMFRSRFAVIDDDTMAFLWETGTQVDQRIRIDGETRTVADGALWLEESLPPETLLMGVMAADRGRRSGLANNEKSPAFMLDVALPPNQEETLQFGGKATIGRGRCVIKRLPATSGGA